MSLKQCEDMFLRRLFGMLAKMAKADGTIDAREVHAAEGAFSRFPRAAARRKFCARVFNESKKSRISLYRQAWEFANMWASPSDCLVVYELLWDIACSTAPLKPVHKSNLVGICKYLNLPEAYFQIYYFKRFGTFREWTYSGQATQEEARNSRYSQEKKQTSHETSSPPRPKTSLQKAYELIGCASDADDAAVRRAYRLAAKKCHPDILRASGASEGRVAAATEQMARINDACDTIRKARGM